MNKTTPYKRVALEPFDYTGVTPGNSFWQWQAPAGRDFYLEVASCTAIGWLPGRPTLHVKSDQPDLCPFKILKMDQVAVESALDKSR